MSEAAIAGDLELLHVDAALIVAVKPSGLLAVPGRGSEHADCLAARAQARFGDALVVHRLDMATSGLMLFARGALAQRRLSQAFAQREVGKRYRAVVQGRLDARGLDGVGACGSRVGSGSGIGGNGIDNAIRLGNDDAALIEGEIDLPLSADWPNRPRQRVDLEHGKPSLTRYRVVRHDADNATTHVELEPLTGRSHQLRVHLAALGHPILGDALYAPPAVHERAARLLLHATALAFAHPLSALPLRFESPAPF